MPIPSLPDEQYTDAIAANQGFCVSCRTFVATETPDMTIVYNCSTCSRAAVLHSKTAYDQGEFHLLSDNMDGDECEDDEDEDEDEDDDELYEEEDLDGANDEVDELDDPEDGGEVA